MAHYGKILSSGEINMLETVLDVKDCILFLEGFVSAMEVIITKLEDNMLFKNEMIFHVVHPLRRIIDAWKNRDDK